MFDVALGDDGVGDLDLGYAEELRQVALYCSKTRVGLLGEGVSQPRTLGLRGLADGLGDARLFEHLKDLVAQGEQLVPVSSSWLVLPGTISVDIGEEREMHAGLAAFDLGQQRPDLVGGEAEDRRDEPREGFGDPPDGGLRAAAAGWFGAKV